MGFSRFPQVSVTASPHHNPQDNSSLSEKDRKVSLRPSLPQTMAPQTLRPQEEGCFHLSQMWLANRAKRTDNRTMTRVGFSLETERVSATATIAILTTHWPQPPSCILDLLRVSSANIHFCSYRLAVSCSDLFYTHPVKVKTLYQFNIVIWLKRWNLVHMNSIYCGLCLF